MCAVEVIAGWCTFDFLILVTATTLFDPLPNLFAFNEVLWHSVVASAAFSVTGSVMHALAIKKVRHPHGGMRMRHAA